MADAWPMVARCKVAQWRGLSPFERDLSPFERDLAEEQWDHNMFPLHWTGHGTVIWSVETGDTWLPLMAMKWG